jgi:LytR cell envelope-related transcriptional attenuator
VLPVIVVGVLALAVGGGLGWYLTNRDDTATTATTPTPTGCATTPAATGSPSGSPKAAKPPPDPSSITVDVYNATDVQGLAGKTAGQLEKRGFQIGDVANDPIGQPITGTAEVRYGKKGRANAKVVAAQVVDSTLVNDKRADRSVALALGEKFDGLATPAEVEAALSPSPSPTC